MWGPRKHLLTERDELLIRSFAMQSLKWSPSFSHLLTSGWDVSCVLHQSRQHWCLVSDCVCVGHSMWHLIVLTIPAQLHHCVLCEAIRLHVAFDRIPIVISALHPAAVRCSESDDGWLRVALQCGFTAPERMKKHHDSFDCPRFFDIFSQPHAAQDVLMSVFLQCDARH